MTSIAPSIQTKNFPDTRQHLRQIVNQVARRETRILIEKSGVPVAALVSADDLRRLAELDVARDERAEAMRGISRAFADVPVDELEAQVIRALREARGELRRPTGPHVGR